jgi:hypothetical protein
MRSLLIVLLLAGCSHSAVLVNGGATARPTANATGAIAAAAMVTAIAVTASQEPSAAQSTSSNVSAWASQPLPVLDSERSIAEQDCTQPIDVTAGNLRCR